MSFRYPGGKSKIKKQIIARIRRFYKGHYDVEYVEPFAGALAIGTTLLKSIPLRKICINDRDPGISAFWNSVINFAPELYKLIDDFTPSVEKFYTFKETLKDESICLHIEDLISRFSSEYVEFGFMKLAIHQISYSGLGTQSGGPLGGKEQTSNYKIDCRWNAPYIKNKIMRYHFLLQKLQIRGRKCFCSDFSTILRESSNSFVYLDPPYYEKGPELYQFHFRERDHLSLADLLSKMKFPWLLSYDCNDTIKEMYNWASMIELNLNYTINTSRNKKELLIAPVKYKYLLDSVEEEIDIFAEEGGE
jgi:DNA adenine methylase